jgi:hypothetical protein
MSLADLLTTYSYVSSCKIVFRTCLSRETSCINIQESNSPCDYSGSPQYNRKTINLFLYYSFTVKINRFPDISVGVITF